MPISSKDLVELVLFGPAGDRRQLQDSPLLGDVWLAYAGGPGKRLDLLITPDWNLPAGPIAKFIASSIGKLPGKKEPARSEVAYLHGLIAARLTFRELLILIAPRTVWWRSKNAIVALEKKADKERIRALLRMILLYIRGKGTDEEQRKASRELIKASALDRYVALAGLILWAGKVEAPGIQEFENLENPDAVSQLLEQLYFEIQEVLNSCDPSRIHPKLGGRNLIYEVSLNRKAYSALEKSVPAVKGDAARSLFKVDCRNIGWAVLDSGIDAKHPAFDSPPEGRAKRGKTRVLKALDFSNIRQIIGLEDPAPAQRTDLLRKAKKNGFGKTEANAALDRLAEDAANDQPLNWELIEKFIEIPVTTDPSGSHGSHVAGILGANGTSQGSSNSAEETSGLCPDIKLFDLRVISDTVENTEFAIIAALQYIRYLNSRQGLMQIHGANLSLSIPHDVRNFACGRTPICDECHRLVDSGVVVVAAAGNRGYHSFETKDGSFDGYAAFSITDPGNAEDVITVGSTHRFWPHTYGVSFFSSRGPTGDGRIKPDLVAPGERIRSCLAGESGDWGALDGTSMAAPHVSGAAAMLMARYPEFVGQPRRIKRILCESATDLGRERTFQGHGMLDVLRAFQSI